MSQTFAAVNEVGARSVPGRPPLSLLERVTLKTAVSLGLGAQRALHPERT